MDVRMTRDIEKEAGHTGERSGTKAATDDGAGPTVKDQVVGNEASTDDVDEGEASTTGDKTNLHSTINDEIKILIEAILLRGEISAPENLIGELHFLNMIHTRSKVLAHKMIIDMAAGAEVDRRWTSGENSENLRIKNRKALYKGRKCFHQ
jgi:hypothetical protein